MVRRCKYCDYMNEYYAYKTRRKDGNDCLEMKCMHKAVIENGRGKRICSYRPFGGLRNGKDARPKTSPRWCPLGILR